MEAQNLETDAIQSQESPAPKKKRRVSLILLLLVIVLALAGSVAFYFIQRQKPVAAVEEFLTHMQKMDLDGMSRMLQSSDLSALDDADIRDAAYTDFFRGINQKMTYEIKKNEFNIQNGTANVTVSIRYIDGSEIYKETISEFMRQVVSSAISGEALEEAEINEKLAALLTEKAGQLKDQYTETTLTYPVINANGNWKIVALDEETVKVMSANFKSVEEEIREALNGSDSNAAVPNPESTDTIDFSTDQFSIHYTQHTTAKDLSGQSCLLVFYEYTNHGNAPSSAMVDVSLQAYQNGEACSPAIPESTEESIDNFMKEIQPGETITVCQAFSLTDTSEVTLSAGEAFHFGENTTTSQILKLS